MHIKKYVNFTIAIDSLYNCFGSVIVLSSTGPPLAVSNTKLPFGRSDSSSSVAFVSSNIESKGDKCSIGSGSSAVEGRFVGGEGWRCLTGGNSRNSNVNGKNE